MDRYLVTAWARKIVLVLFCVVAFVWGIRQATLTYQIWFPDQTNSKKKITKGVPEVPASAKLVGQQFLQGYYDTKKDEIWELKEKRISNWVTDHVQDQWVRTPSLLLLSENMEAENVVLWNEKWLKVGTKASIEYQVTLEDQRTMQLQVVLVKSGSTWLVDGLPSLLPQPKRGKVALQPSPSVSEKEQNKMEQAADGFFDSWLKGRVDANTKSIPQTPTNLLKAIDGEYRAVTIEPIQEKPLLVNATVFIEMQSNNEKKQIVPFQYQLELTKNNGQYVVKRVIW